MLHTIAVASLVVGVLCTAVVAVDIAAGQPQRMWIMNIVWPITALYSGPLGLWAYYRIGRLSAKPCVNRAREHGVEPAGARKPFWQMVLVGATHCGSGCTLADLLCEWTLLFVPLTLFGRPMYAAWVVDFIVAFLFGIAFQYFTIVPMRDLSPAQGVIAAVKADAASLAAWQVGMYGWMAFAVFCIFGHELEKTGPVFWFMMQIAMLWGFLASYPVNWWLLRTGVKEKM